MRPSASAAIVASGSGCRARAESFRSQGSRNVDDDLPVGASERPNPVAGCMLGDAAVAVGTRIAADVETDAPADR